MMETIAILFVFFILVGFGFVFYARILKSSVTTQGEEQAQLGAIGIAQKAAFLPELQCSEDNIIKEGCIDILKLNKASAIIPVNQEEYSDMFGFSKIYVNEIFPGNTNWPTLYDNSPSNYKTKLVTHVPISLYDATLKSYSFGVLVVEAYTK